MDRFASRLLWVTLAVVTLFTVLEVYAGVVVHIISDGIQGVMLSVAILGGACLISWLCLRHRKFALSIAASGATLFLVLAYLGLVAVFMFGGV